MLQVLSTTGWHFTTIYFTERSEVYFTWCIFFIFETACPPGGGLLRYAARSDGKSNISLKVVKHI
ncbi:hypothetical protein [Algoriphagus marincola]|uniref:hypothetical protein n=1 Tax=Algoriphagus marincola TaxID=264027 RepID=UPI00138B1372|nr:hypothetical protein [Algoriphagus marincola]